MSSINSLYTGTYYGVSSGFFGSVFGSGSASTSTSSLSSLASDYTSIRNGSYYKLLKAYYNGNSKIDSVSSTSKTNKSSNLSYGSEQKNAITVRDNAKALKEDALKLVEKGSKSLFNKVDVKKEDGTTERGYDTDAIYKAVSSFVKDYNSTIESAADSNNNSTLISANSMVNTTKANKELLSDVGITVGSDNKLTIDEKAFKASDMSDVKSLFNGVGSYAYNVANNASSMYNKSVSQLAQLNGSSYTSSGGYSGYQYSGSLYNSYL